MDIVRPPSGTVTFLFSDIEGSTPLWEEHRLSMETALLRHDAIMRAAIETHKGYVFKTVGDAFCAAFDHASDALAAAIEAQLRLAEEQWPADVGRLTARMGLHSGAALERADDYFGPTVNRAARVEAAAHGGQILLTHAVEQLLLGELPPNVTLIDLGEHRLKGIATPGKLFQVAAAGLARDFPPLHTLDPQHTNLPAEPDDLYGRENESAYLTNLLTSGHARLVTLTGPGGVGKTTLALHVAADLISTFPDGVWWVPLAPLGDTAAVPASVAVVLGIRELSGTPLTETVRDTLRPKRLLLVMDNFEHLLPSAVFIADWISSAPGLVILATSRSPLRIRSEQEFPLKPLPMPIAGAELDVLRKDAAVTLFMTRAKTVRPELELTSANMEIVSTICRRLEGLPLAIELAAARTRLLPLPDLLDKLDSTLQLLAGGPRDHPERQRSLRATIAWSYLLLAPEEQRLFRALSVFRGGFSLDAVAAIFQLQSSITALDCLEPLAEQSLIHPVEAENGPRYSMLEAVREFAMEGLTSSGELDHVLTLHLDYYWEYPQRQNAFWQADDNQTWFLQLDSERDNLRAALYWALNAQRPNETAERGAWLAGNLWLFWLLRNSIDEANRTLRQALDVVDWICPARGKALIGAGIFAWQTGDYAAAEAWFYEALMIWRSFGDINGLADATHMMGHLEFDRRRYGPAHDLFQESLVLYTTQGNDSQIATLTADLGLVAMHTEEFETAESCYQSALQYYRLHDSSEAISDVLFRLGDLCRIRGDIDGAAELFEEGLGRVHSVGYKLGIACGYHKLAQIERLLGRTQIAGRNLREALALQNELGNRQGIIECLAALGGLALEEGQVGKGVRLLAAASELLSGLGAPLSPPDRDQFLHDDAAARRLLDKEEFSKVWTAGQRMTVDEAVRLGIGAE